MQNFDKRLRSARSVVAWFDENCIAGDERLEGLNGRQKERVVSWSDDENQTVRLALDFAVNAAKPEGAPPPSESPSSQDAPAFVLKKSARGRERNDFRRQDFSRRTLPKVIGGFSERCCFFDNEQPGAPDDF